MLLEQFEIWFNQNRDKFICKLYIFKNGTKNKTKKYLQLRFENIMQEIYVYVNKREINIWVELGKITESEDKVPDILADFYVDEKQNAEGKYYNGGHVKPHSHNTLKEVYDEEFNYFLEWVNSNIKKENFLAVTWTVGVTSARIMDRAKLNEKYVSNQTDSDYTAEPLAKDEIAFLELLKLKKPMIISGSGNERWDAKILLLTDITTN